ncbi:hypothetical protein FRC08_002796 [Ceratobasidium sp. 394]|nr:hypothetical protein FRC08_002796 [Ceratobasidium sp. 394]
MSQEYFSSIPHPNCPPALPGNGSVRTALNEWKSLRTLLADTIQSYLTASATLRAVCVQSLRLPHERLVVEKALTSVGSELHSMVLEEKALRDTRISLSKLRNESTTLARTNTLPPEILTKIFMLSRTYCVHDDGAKLSYNALAGVSTYWRQIVINAPDLWTHIDIGPDTPTQSVYGLAKLLLRRTEGRPVHVHVFEPPKPPHGEPTSKLEIKAVTDFLSPFIHRVCTLDLDTRSYSRSLIQPVLELWASNGGSSASKALYVYRPNGTQLLRPASHLNCGMILPSLRILHLQGTVFNWNSPAYHGLVDLRIEATGQVDISVSVSQLANVLAMSPKLATLILSHVEVTSLEGWDAPTPIVLGCLQVLNLVNTRPGSTKLVLPLITQPDPCAQLCVGLIFITHCAEEFKDFSSRSHITTLYCDGYSLAALRRMPPINIPYLVLHGEAIHLHAAEIVPALPGAEIFSHVSRLTLLSCSLTFKSLVKFIVATGIKSLRLDCCLVEDQNADCHPLPLDMQDALSEACPGLECTVSNTDSSKRLPCRIIFDGLADL